MDVTESATELNRSIMEHFYAAGLQGDIETMMGYVADDVVIYEPTYLPFGGEYRGKDSLSAIHGAVAQLADVAQFTIHYILVDGDRAIAIGGFPVNDTGQFTHFAEESRLEDGKIVEIRIYYHDAQSMIGTASGGADGPGTQPVSAK